VLYSRPLTTKLGAPTKFRETSKLMFEQGPFHERIVGILTFALERLTDTQPNLENKK